MDIAEKVLRLKDDFDDVYDAGKKTEYDAFWDAYQNYGTRNNYGYAFAYWGNFEYIRPKYKVVPTYASGVYAMFHTNKAIKKIEAQYFDFSQKTTGTGLSGGYGYTFNSCSNLEEIEDIGLIAQNTYSNAFAYCTVLHTIAKLGCDENTAFDNTFRNCYALRNITIDGVIGQNGFNVSASTYLTHDSLMSIIDHLADKSGTGTTWTITLGSTNLAKLTDAEKAIATQKGWTLA